MKDLEIVNIYGQESPHEDAKIVGNKAGLTQLKTIIEHALAEGRSIAEVTTSDGEGYDLQVQCHDDDWGCNAPADSFWNKDESAPEYTDYGYKKAFSIEAETTKRVAGEIKADGDKPCEHWKAEQYMKELAADTINPLFKPTPVTKFQCSICRAPIFAKYLSGGQT